MPMQFLKIEISIYMAANRPRKYVKNFRPKEIYFLKVDAISIVGEFSKEHLGIDNIKSYGVF